MPFAEFSVCVFLWWYLLAILCWLYCCKVLSLNTTVLMVKSQEALQSLCGSCPSVGMGLPSLAEMSKVSPCVCEKWPLVTHGILPSRRELSLTDKYDQSREKSWWYRWWRSSLSNKLILVDHCPAGTAIDGEVFQGLSTTLAHCLLVQSMYALCRLFPPGHRRGGWICTTPEC